MLPDHIRLSKNYPIEKGYWRCLIQSFHKNLVSKHMKLTPRWIVGFLSGFSFRKEAPYQVYFGTK